MTIVSNRGTNGLLWFTISNPDTGLTRRDHTIAHHLPIIFEAALPPNSASFI